MSFSIKKLIMSLINIIIESPTSILFIILGIIFSVAMIINMKKNKTIGKTLYLAGWIFIIAFILIKYNNYLSTIFDNLINTIFRQIFFPNLASYTIIIIITNIIFLYTVFNKKNSIANKLINSPFFITIMVLMVHTIDQISKNNVNVYEKKEVYSNSNIVTLIESTTLLFTLWIIILISKHIIRQLIKKSDEKIKEEFKEKTETNIESTENPAIVPTPETTNTVLDNPAVVPTPEPTNTVLDNPNIVPTPEPTNTVLDNPTIVPTPEPTNTVLDNPTIAPTPEPTNTVLDNPTIAPTPEHINTVIENPAVVPTPEPINQINEIENTKTLITPNNIFNGIPSNNVQPITPIPKPNSENQEINNEINTPNIFNSSPTNVNNNIQKNEEVEVLKI